MNAILQETTPNYTAIKQRQQASWGSGDYAIIGTTLQIVGETLAEAVDLRAREKVLDVAAGNGNASLAAARRFAVVTATDYVPALLDKGRARAAAENLPIRFEPADAEALPYPEGAFDVVLSTFGVMFAPDQSRAAAEMLRVVRPGGRIALANWTPGGFIGRLFGVLGSVVPPPAGVKSPALWGTEPYVVQLFGAHAAQIRCERRHFHFRYESPAHWLHVFRTWYGPVHKAFASLDAQRARQLESSITALMEELNQGGEHALVIPSEYLEIVITRA